MFTVRNVTQFGFQVFKAVSCCCCCENPAALLLSSVVQVKEVCDRSRVVPL